MYPLENTGLMPQTIQIPGTALIAQPGTGCYVPVMIEAAIMSDQPPMMDLNAVSAQMQGLQNYDIPPQSHFQSYSSYNPVEVCNVQPQFSTAPVYDTHFPSLITPNKESNMMRMNQNEMGLVDDNCQTFAKGSRRHLEEDKEELKESYSQGSNQGRKRAR